MVNKDFSDAIRRLNFEYEKKINKIIFHLIRRDSNKIDISLPSSLSGENQSVSNNENQNSSSKFINFFKIFFGK